MAIIIREERTIGGEKVKGVKVYKTSRGHLLTNEEIDLAEKYDEELKNEIKEITSSLKSKGFFEIKATMKKWYMLGRKLQFLDKMPLRTKCDPDLKNTFRVFYDLALILAPRKDFPTDKERLEGDRNHFYVCYKLAKYSWELVKDIPWGNWQDIHAAFSPTKGVDRKRLLSWVLSKSEKANNREKLRKALKTFRAVVGQTAEIERDTTVLSKEELYKLLDQKLNTIK